MFQYDSDGSDSQESSEEAELRRKKIEALKVSLQGTLLITFCEMTLNIKPLHKLTVKNKEAVSPSYTTPDYLSL